MRFATGHRSLLLLVVAGVVAVSCGSDDGELGVAAATAVPASEPEPGDEPGDEPEGEPAAERSRVDDITNTDEHPLPTQGFPDECPSDSETLELMNQATYSVFHIVEFEDDQGQSQVTGGAIGTAWAVGDRLLATNAHVSASFPDAAERGTQLTRAVAVQSTTGEVVRLLRGIDHPDYGGPFEVLSTPDVALFTTQEVLPVTLPLAPADSVVPLGATIGLTGFPGDVDQFIPSFAGATVPQATSLLGTITARRSYDVTAVVDVDTLDYYQHQAPTTPGTSGSAMMHCGLVVGVNNAGTINVWSVQLPDGTFRTDRQAAAANNFAVHVKHLHELLELFEANALQGYELPVDVTSAPPPPAPDQPAPEEEATIAGSYQGAIVSGDLLNEFSFQVSETGAITGTSSWPATGQFTLTGEAGPDGTFVMVDDAPERLDYRRGVYEGVFDGSGGFIGAYYEEGNEDVRFDIAGARIG